jgi:hypothetical protein
MSPQFAPFSRIFASFELFFALIKATICDDFLASDGVKLGHEPIIERGRIPLHRGNDVETPA